MRKELIADVMQRMLPYLDNAQMKQLQRLIGHQRIDTTLQYVMIKAICNDQAEQCENSP